MRRKLGKVFHGDCLGGLAGIGLARLRVLVILNDEVLMRGG